VLSVLTNIPSGNWPTILTSAIVIALADQEANALNFGRLYETAKSEIDFRVLQFF
jgi:hypothetical protein